MNLSIPQARLFVVCAIVFLCSCGCSGGHSPNDDAGISLNRGLNVEPDSLDPHRFASNSAANVLRDIGEGLLTYSADGALVGGVAESWSLSDDGLVYTFHLRPDAKWQNGSGVVAPDFVYSFRRLVTPNIASPYAEFLSPIRNAYRIITGELPPSDLGVVAIDALTLEIELDLPTAYFPQLLTHPSSFPIRELSMREQGENLGRSGGLVTNGAYTLVNWSLGSNISLVRNTNYWDNERTGYDLVTYHFVQESAEINRYRAGELDVTANVDGAMFKLMRNERPTELKVSPYLGVYYYGFNLTRGIFSNNPDLRRALSMAINREDLVEHITGRGEQPAYGWVPPGIDGYASKSFDYSQMSSDEREDAARRLYEKAGFGQDNPLKFELRYNTSDVQKRIAVAVQSMWREVLGVEVTLVNEEFQVLLSNIRAMTVTEMFRLSWTGDYNDPLTFLQLFKTDNPSNLTGFTSSTVDAFLDEAASLVDTGARFESLANAEAAAIDDHPVVPLYFYVSKHLVRENVVGWQDNVLDIHYSKHLSPRLGGK